MNRKSNASSGLVTIQLRKEVRNEWVLITDGIISIVFGAMMITLAFRAP